MRIRRLLTGLLLAALFMAGAALGEEWNFDDNGFLTGENPGREYVLEDEKNGVWRYASADLSVEIHRYKETVKIKKKNRIREYCIADIHASPAQPMNAIMTQPLRTKPAGYSLVSPELLMEAHPAVFSMSDDLYGLRLKQYKYYGVIIRNREILARKTKNSASPTRSWPYLDTLAVYEDGSMKTYLCDAYTPEEYLEQGAVHVFAFGPILISDGVINDLVYKKYLYNEPRVAIGMVEPWHYVAIVVRGRPDDQYAGVHLDWLAEKMQEMGCVEALNLDGGLTATMAFMGKIIETGGGDLRSQGSMITFGSCDAETLAELASQAEAEKYPAEAKTVKAKVNVREKPDKDSKKVTQIAKAKTTVTILAEEKDQDGTVWYYIRTADGKEGYVRSDMVQ